MASFLDKKDGVYDKTKRFIVHNWSDEDFTQHFAAETGYNGTQVIDVNPAYDITIKAGESRECGEFEALFLTKHLVNREMNKEVSKIKDYRERENKGMLVDNPTERKPYEDKTLSEIKQGEESPIIAKIKADAIAEYQRKQEMQSGNVNIAQRPAEVPQEVVQEVEKIDKRTKEYKQSVKEFEL